MKVDEGQKGQLIALCVLVALVLGFGAYRLVGITTSAAPKPVTKHVSTIKTPQSGEKPQAAAESSDSHDVAADPYVAPTVADKDPFLPNLNALKSNQKRVRAQTPVKAMPVRHLALRPLTPAMPSGLQPITGMSVRPVSAAGRDASMQPDVDPSKDLKLTGVIEGETNVAVIRGAGSARYIVHEGQTVDGRYVVDFIGSKGIILSFNGRKFVLRLGGNDSSEKGTRRA